MTIMPKPRVAKSTLSRVARYLKRMLWVCVMALFVIAPGFAQVKSGAIPGVTLNIGAGQNGGDLNSSLQILILLTVLSLAPAIIALLTGFTRIVIVLGFTRSALGTQQVPPNSVLIGLALFLTAFTMAPVGRAIYTEAYQPYIAHRIGIEAAQQRAMAPLRAFMLRQTPESDLLLFVNIAKIPRPATLAEVPTYVLVPAFVVGELKIAFTMGFLIYIPFVIIDLVVAAALMSMGMMMMPPVLISLPCKIMLFVLIDGWSLVASSLVTSFH